MLDDSGEMVPESEDDSSVLGYIREGLQEADNFYRKQIGWNKMDLVDQMVMGEFPDEIRSLDLSQTVDNEFGAIYFESIAQSTDIKPFFTFTSASPAYQMQAEMLNKGARHWWLSEQTDMRFRDAIAGAKGHGSAALWTTWDPNRQEFFSKYADCRDARVVRPWSVHSYQDCKMLVMVEEVSTNYLRRRFPSFASRIRMDRDAMAVSDESTETFTQNVIRRLGVSNMARYLSTLKKSVVSLFGSAMPVADLYTAYVHDDRRNEGTTTRLMGPWKPNGRPGSMWSYQVEPGERLYPYGRVVVAINSCVFYDGPNNYWHAQFPVSKLTFNQVPFPRCYFGKSPMWDLIEEQKALNRTRRAIDDHIQKFVDPDLIIDSTTGMSRQSAEKVRARKPGGKFFRRGGAAKGWEFQYPPPLPAEVLSYPDVLISRMRSKAGTVDWANVLNKGQIPSPEAASAMINAATGHIRDTSRTLEAFMREYAMQVAFNIAQYWTKKKRLRLFGPKGLTVEDFDPDGPNMVPYHIGEDYNQDGSVKEDRHSSFRPRRERAMDLIGFMSFDIEPNSLLPQARFEEQMKYLQLARGGFIDPQTALEHMDIPNVGEMPPGPDGKTPTTVIERLVRASELQLMGQVSAAGRKASGQNPPQVKSSGAISEST